MSFDRLTGLDTGAVSAWLGTLGLDAARPLRFAPAGNGKSNLTSVVTDASGTRWVLRRPPLGKLLPSAHDVAREHRVLSALQPTPVPTPGVLGFTDDPAVTDAPLLLMSYVDGIVVDSPQIAAAMTPEGRGRLGRSLARTLALVHAVDLAETGLDTLASHEPYAPRQLRRWLRQWAGSKTRELPAVDRLAGRLAAAVPEQHEVTLVHGDLHLVNVIAAPDGSAIRAVVDWELCTLGDPVADLGTLLAYWQRPGDPIGGIFPASRLPGFPERAELVASYAAEAGDRDLSALPFWHALALWKVAVIAEGIRRRALDRQRDPDELVSATLVEDCVAEATRVADLAGL